MPRNGSGTYTLPQSPFVAGTTISSAAVNSDFSDIATALTASISSSGETPIIGQLQFPVGTETVPSHTFGSELTTGMYLQAAGVLAFTCLGNDMVVMDSTKVGTGKSGDILSYGNGAIPAPVGRISDFGGSAAPSGWFLCYGQAISRTSYPELFTVIGTNFGSGDGTTTYNLPDLRGRVTAGKDDMGGSAASRLTTAGSGVDGLTLGASGGAQTITLDLTMIPAHNHGVNIIDSGHTHTVASSGTSSSLGANSFTAVGGGGSTTTSSATTGITATTNNSGGSAAHHNVQPTLIVNKMIFAGRP